MARQDFNLGLIDNTWEGSFLVIPELIEGGVTAYLRFARLIGENYQLRIAATAAGDPTVAGPSLSDIFTNPANDDSAIIFTSEDRIIEIRNPGHSSNPFADPTEPYFWSPSNGAALNTFYSDSFGAILTLTLFDGVDFVFQELEVDISTPVPEASIAVEIYLPTYNNIQVDIEAPAPEVTITPDTYVPFTLSVVDLSSYEVDFAALIRANALPNIYRDSDRGGVQSPIEGELGLSGTETVISQITWNGSVFRFNDNDNPLAIDIGDYYENGPGSNQTLILRTESTATIVIPIDSLNIVSAGGGWANFSGLPADAVSLLNGLSANDLLIVAAGLLNPPVDIIVDIETPAPEVSITVELVIPVYNNIQVNIESPVPETNVALSSFVVTVHNIQVNIETPIPEANVLLDSIAFRALQVNIETPVPEANVTLESVQHRVLIVDITVPAPEVVITFDLITVVEEEINIDSISIVGSTVVINLSEAVLSGDKIILNYVVPPNFPVQNSAGESATSITNLEVVNNT